MAIIIFQEECFSIASSLEVVQRFNLAADVWGWEQEGGVSHWFYLVSGASRRSLGDTKGSEEVEQQRLYAGK